MELLHECPVCANRNIKYSTRVVDHFLSKEEFQIFQCFTCGLLFTNPQPDATEIASYYQSEDYISHSNTKKGIVNKAYQAVRRSTLKWKSKIVIDHMQTGTILDIGCGTGHFLNQMRSLGWKTSGVEPEPMAREAAINNYSLEVKGEEVLTTFESSSFDVITLWHVLEHVIDVNKRLEEIHRLLKPDGLLILALPNPSSPDAVRYDTYWAAWDVPRHLYHFKPNAVHSIVSSKGFRHITSKGMLFDAYYISMLSEKYRGSFLSPVQGLIKGFLSNLAASRRDEAYSSMCYLFRK